MGSASPADRSPSRQISTSAPVTRTLSRASGSRNFQAKAINWSMRNRGRVPRLQMNREKTRYSFPRNRSQPGTHSSRPQAVQPPRYRVTMMAQTANAAMYSAA